MAIPKQKQKVTLVLDGKANLELSKYFMKFDNMDPALTEKFRELWTKGDGMSKESISQNKFIRYTWEKCDRTQLGIIYGCLMVVHSSQYELTMHHDNEVIGTLTEHDFK